MNYQLPQYLFKLKTNLQISLFVAIFSLLFISVYNPIELSQWMPAADSSGVRFAYSAIIILGGIVVIALSRLLLCRVARKHEISLIEYGCWLLSEIVIIALAYMMMTKLGLKDSRPFLEILRNAIVNILLMLAIPYMVSYLYVALKDKELKINDFKLKLSKGEMLSEDDKQGHANSSDQLHTPAKNSLICFHDEKGELRLTVRLEYLYYIESSENYVNIYYKKGNKLTHTMIRTSLKSLEEQLGNYGFVRCHRAYLVHIDKIKIVRKERDGFFIDFDIDGAADIPVSKTYSEQVMNLLA